MRGYPAAILLLGLAGCGGGAIPAGPPAKVALSREQAEAIRKQDQAVEEQEGGAFKRRVEAQGKGKAMK